MHTHEPLSESFDLDNYDALETEEAARLLDMPTQALINALPHGEG